jgi:hypothetical protein
MAGIVAVGAGDCAFVTHFSSKGADSGVPGTSPTYPVIIHDIGPDVYEKIVK